MQEILRFRKPGFRKPGFRKLADSGKRTTCDSGNCAIQKTESARFRGGGGCGGGVGGADDNVPVRALQFPESAGFRNRVLQFPESAGFRIPPVS